MILAVEEVEFGRGESENVEPLEPKRDRVVCPYKPAETRSPLDKIPTISRWLPANEPNVRDSDSDATSRWPSMVKWRLLHDVRTRYKIEGRAKLELHFPKLWGN
jgi:hypothetical protein